MNLGRTAYADLLAEFDNSGVPYLIKVRHPPFYIPLEKKCEFWERANQNAERLQKTFKQTLNDIMGYLRSRV